jgi:hypothetical protein
MPVNLSAVNFGQSIKAAVSYIINFMSLSKLASSAAMFLLGAALLALPCRGFGQTNYYASYGTEYPVIGALPGDQIFPDVAVTPAGGIVVWQDNITDGSGWGISARRLDSTFSGTLSTFRVNVQGTNDQENPRVAILKNGGAAFVWQGGARGSQHIFARFLSPTNTWLTTTDLVVSTFTNTFQITPALTVLNDSNVVVVWASYNQAGAGSLLDVYGKILSPTGVTVSNTFLINQFLGYNQRTPAVTALAKGGFAVAWVSEQERSTATPSAGQYYSAVSAPIPSVDIYARIYASNGAPVTSEFAVNTNYYPCANPALASASDGSFMVAWSQHDMLNHSNSWDVFARSFSTNGTGGTVVPVNSYTYGDQYAPQISAIGLDYLIVFTSVGQDGPREGVFGQFVHKDGSLVGGEFQVNTTSVGRQMQPTVASDGSYQFEVVWTSFASLSLADGFDLAAQRYASVSALLQPMAAPFVNIPFTLSSNIYVPQLVVSWSPLLGISVSNFEVYADGAATPTAIVKSNEWVMGAANGLMTSSTHYFQVDYVTAAGVRSPLSPSASGTTWSGINYQGIPYEWVASFYGDDSSTWPANVNAPLIPGGYSLAKVFYSGGDPLDPTTWLRVVLSKTSQGMFLSWNTQPGHTYQVVTSTNIGVWTNVGSPRFAAGTSDSIYVGTTPSAYFQVGLLR